jgi:hypothetical protein
MNKIYIVTNDLHFEVVLDFLDNIFIKDGISYKFIIIEKDELKILWNNTEEETFYTNDSYLYYSENIRDKYIEKYFFIHKEWSDQALINLKEYSVRRIKDNDQYGTITYKDDKIIIDWNYWGKEVFIKRDNYTFIEIEYDKKTKNNNENIENISNSKNRTIIFIHICCINDWEAIFNEQICKLKESGLYDEAYKIYLGILGNVNIIKSLVFEDSKFSIMYVDERTSLYEIHTINYIKYICEHSVEELNILYIHTKGVRQAGNSNVTKSWRNMMEFFLIENYKLCLDNLNRFDTIGTNVVNLYCTNKDEISINNNHTYHYSGNFWWSKKSYIDKLDYIELDLTKNSFNKRYKAENWILSKYPDINCGVIFQDDTNTHPYHRYVFDYYKEFNIFIKNL